MHPPIFVIFHPFFNAVGFPVQSQPEALYSMSNALSSKTTAVAVMMDATRQDQSTAGAISCATGKKGRETAKKKCCTAAMLVVFF